MSPCGTGLLSHNNCQPSIFFAKFVSFILNTSKHKKSHLDVYCETSETIANVSIVSCSCRVIFMAGPHLGQEIHRQGPFTLSVSMNTVMTLAILLSLKTMEYLQYRVATHFGATPLFSMRPISLVLSQRCDSIDVDAWENGPVGETFCSLLVWDQLLHFFQFNFP